MIYGLTRGDMCKEPDLTIYILSHNRPVMLCEMLRSVLNQTYQKFRIVISDNSDDDSVKRELEKNGLLDKVEYVFRNQSKDHFNTILSEVNTSFFMMLHDDDCLLPDMVRQLYEVMHQDDYVAVASNAYMTRDMKEVYGRFIKGDSDIIIENTDQLYDCYYGGKGNAPFPAYMYAAERIKKKKIEYIANAYSDAVWIGGLLNYGKIHWIVEPLMKYRIHSGQDSSKPKWKDAQLLLSYFEKNSSSNIKRNEIRKTKKIYFICSLRENLSLLGGVIEFCIKHRLIKFAKKFDTIYVYGCGKVGLKCMSYLKKLNICMKGFVVSDASSVSSEVEGYPVYEFSELLLKSENAGVILGLGRVFCNEILSRPDVIRYRDRFVEFSKYEI